MKIFQLTILLFSMFSFVVAQDSKPSLKITGTVKEISARELDSNEDSAIYVTYVSFNFKLQNTSSVPIIFLQKKLHIENGFVFKCSDLDKTDNLATLVRFDKYLAVIDRSRSSFAMTKNEWSKLKTDLNQPFPPVGITRIVNPNETIEFESIVVFNLPTISKPSMYFSVPMSSELEILQKSSPLQMIIKFDAWATLNLYWNEKSQQQKKKEFGEILRKKWKDSGYLWLEDIEAEPISINFNSIIFKNLID